MTLQTYVLDEIGLNNFQDQNTTYTEMHVC